LLRTIVLLAGLGAALITGGLAAVRGETVPSTSQSGWVEQHIQEITPGETYRLDGCLTVTAPGIEFVSLRVSWYADPDGSGSALKHDELPGNPWLVGSEQCLSLTNAADPVQLDHAPCAARSARYGVWVKGNTDAVSVDSSSLHFYADPEGTLIACPTTPPSPTPMPTPTPISSPPPSPTPTSAPAPPPAPPPSEAEAGEASSQTTEPRVFASLTNGGFEDVREDGTPYGWRKVGGEMSASRAFQAQGERSAALVSRTASTKWIYQTVRVEGETFYRLRSVALKNDSRVQEALLRVSWYESADGSGRQIGTADSPALAEDSPEFVMLDTGPLQAPVEARSAKVRLLIRPASAAPAAVYFDAVRFEETEAPTATSADSGQAEQRPAGGATATAHDRPAQARQVQAAALGVWRGPTPLANVRQESEPQASPDAGSSRPFWPLLLALAVPAAALGAMASHAWWRARLAGINNRHL
jgi:hypothetical protein